MQRRDSVQIAYFFGLLLFGLLLSVISRRVEPLCAVLPFVVALAYSRLSPTRTEVQLNCTIAPERAFEGEPITVRLSLRAETDLPPMELWHVLPADAVCTSGAPRLVITLRAGEERVYEHQVIFPRRGDYTLGRVYCRLYPNVGLQPLLAEYRFDQTCQVYPHIAPLHRHLPPRVTQAAFGQYVSKSVGEGVEFANIRPYQVGDRMRRIHWRTSLKRQQLYVNEYYREHNADVIILLDTLVAVGAPRATNTLDVAVRAAASLATHYLQQKDRVGLVQYGGVCTWVLPSSGPQQRYRILEALLETRTHFSYLTRDIAMIPPRVLPPGALIFILTTLLDPRIEAALQDLIARGFQIVLVVISPVRVMQEPSAQTEAADRLWRLETGVRLHEFHRLGIPILIQETDDPLQYLHAVLARGNVWRPAR